MKNEEILNSFLAEMLSLLQNTKAFAAEQLPLICQEMVKHGAIIHGICVFSGLLLVLTLPLSIGYLIKKGGDGDALGALITVSAFSALFGAALLANNLSSFVMSVSAPRVYLIHEFKDLLK